MRKVLMICLTIIILTGCTNLKYDIRYEKVSESKVTEHEFDEIEGVYGYVINIDEEKALIVGMNINDEYEQLGATYVSLEYQELLNSGIQVGTKVKYIADGLTFTSYPGYGGIKVTEILKDDVSEAKSSEVVVIQKTLLSLEKLGDKKSHSIYCINNISYEEGVWVIQAVEDVLLEDVLNYYKVYINDETLNIEEIIIYE